MIFWNFCYNIFMLKQKVEKWFDGLIISGRGILLVFKKRKYWFLFFPIFFLFGTLMNLLSNGFSKFELMGAVGFFGSLEIIRDAFFGLFGVNMGFIDWLLIFVVSLLQATVISSLIVVWRKKKKMNSGNLEMTGISAGLAMLGTGCPTCGTALLAPAIGAIFSGSSAIVGTVSWIVTILAIFIALFSLKKIGEDAYVIMVSEEYKKKKREKKNAESD